MSAQMELPYHRASGLFVSVPALIGIKRAIEIRRRYSRLNFPRDDFWTERSGIPFLDLLASLHTNSHVIVFKNCHLQSATQVVSSRARSGKELWPYICADKVQKVTIWSNSYPAEFLNGYSVSLITWRTIPQWLLHGAKQIVRIKPLLELSMRFADRRLAVVSSIIGLREYMNTLQGSSLWLIFV